ATGSGYQLQYHLYSVPREQVILSRTVSGGQNQLRDIAHKLSDEVFEHITGIKGAFSTKLLYVAAERFSADNIRYTLPHSDYDGSRAVTLLQSREPILSPSIAPDRQRIAYVSFESRRPEIYVDYVQTGRRERITSFGGLNGAPAWSPDGKRLALDRKSTRLNSSHVKISYAVFCLKKKKHNQQLVHIK